MDISLSSMTKEISYILSSDYKTWLEQFQKAYICYMIIKHHSILICIRIDVLAGRSIYLWSIQQHLCVCERDWERERVRLGKESTGLSWTSWGPSTVCAGRKWFFMYFSITSCLTSRDYKRIKTDRLRSKHGHFVFMFLGPVRCIVEDEPVPGSPWVFVQCVREDVITAAPW